jgi:hypothetical protein
MNGPITVRLIDEAAAVQHAVGHCLGKSVPLSRKW